MDDRIFLGALIYTLIVIVMGAILPASFFNGSTPTSADVTEGTGIEVQQEGFNFVKGIAIMLFAPVTIQGIPLILGLILNVINLLTSLISGIYIYDKIRGIGS